MNDFLKNSPYSKEFWKQFYNFDKMSKEDFENWKKETCDGTIIPKRFYYRKVERALYEYPTLKTSVRNENQLEKSGLGNLYPSITSNYSEKIKGSGRNESSTELYGMKRAIRSMKIEQIERTLRETMSPLEKQLIELKYFDQTMQTDIEVYHQMGVSETTYYRIKDRIIQKAAKALNII